ncbi:MAG: hypothetical protein ACLRWQ_19480 [Flavonifractor plautii]
MPPFHAFGAARERTDQSVPGGVGAGSGEQEPAGRKALLLLVRYTCWALPATVPGRQEVRPGAGGVSYLEAHCDRRITLEQLSTLAGLSKYHLLRCFTRQKGITPTIVKTVRVNRARGPAGAGPPRWTALRAGFADQSHFNHFSRS